MATWQEVNDFFNRFQDYLQNQASYIIAEKATAYFKERFTTKEWDGSPWPVAKNPPERGTLMVRSGALVATIKPKEVTSTRIVISAGSDKVPYAKAHNEGEEITVPITDKMRKFAWAMHYEWVGYANQQGIEDEIDTPWKGLALTKKKELKIKMPERRFMGQSEKLNDVLFKALKEAFDKL